MIFFVLSALSVASAVPCIAVDGESITIADLAQAIPAFRFAPPGETLAFTPAPGARRIFTARELAMVAARFGINYEPGPPVCFERRTERLTRERVLDAVRAVTGGRPVEIIDFSRNAVPAGTLEFTATAGEMWRGRVRYDRNRSVPVWARVRGAADVERGDVVTVEVLSGEARVAMQARAEGTGRVGEIITVRREDNQRRLRARVAGEGRAVIDANISIYRAGGTGRSR